MDNFVVYTHKRASDGAIFYIGKGRPRRAYSKQGRNALWLRMVEDHGYTVEILRDGLHEECALTIERIEIAKARANGFGVVNICSGGKGSSGFVKNVESVRASAECISNVIYCSSGEAFKSASHAAACLSPNSVNRSAARKIVECARGIRSSCYGHSFSYDWFPDQPSAHGRDAQRESVRAMNKSRKSKEVKSSLGEVFYCMCEAARFLRENGYPKATDSLIGKACRSGAERYGRFWSYANG